MILRKPLHCIALAFAFAAVPALLFSPAFSADGKNLPGTVLIKSPHSYKVLVQRLDAAVKNNKMGLVTRASATLGARNLGITIPGNMVVGVYHPRFAVRMLKASVPAGIEAPIRFYITENADGTASLSWRSPSSVFAPYRSADLDAMARELDRIFARIAAEATGG
jgi:uncharacterized protein (DUF302 family)